MFLSVLIGACAAAMTIQVFYCHTSVEPLESYCRAIYAMVRGNSHDNVCRSDSEQLALLMFNATRAAFIRGDMLLRGAREMINSDDGSMRAVGSHLALAISMSS